MKSIHLILPTLALLAGCAKHAVPESAVAAAAPLPPAKVRLATARAENVATVTEITGTVRPAQRAHLAAKVMGAIEDFPATLGQPVRKGELLLKISAAEITARVTQAQAQLNAARRDLAREKDLLGKSASTADMVRGLEDRLTMTQAMVREAEVMLGYTKLIAPFDGVVARKLANAGDLAAPGMPLLEIEGTADFQVEAAIPDSLAATLAAGTSLAVTIPATNTTFNGTVAEVSSAADANARSVLAKISVPAGAAVRSGQFARVQLSGAPVRTLLAPAAAISTLGQMERVFVVGEGNRAVLRLVKTGAARGDSIEILAGLDDNERVVVHAPASLREGQPLEVLP
ncbi:MAG: efflux RND transporter periplasmic adaptor subunit [Verrucomicrobia bacterium]|nr:efflux RND transporter periplasmic adaptor subunit [Verrucomicrobiota bacterium]